MAPQRQDAPDTSGSCSDVPTVPMLYYLERLLHEHEVHHDRDREAGQRAVDEARNRVDARLAQLNELRREVTEDRGQLVQRVLFDTRMSSADHERGELKDDLADLRSELANMRGRQAAYASVLAVAIVIVPFLIQLLLHH
jgi:predicted  nucleic acid-binding Zn-ribbon protein